ncbi:uncharacterized protein LOC131890882 isoform X1 [Tigriopus californicus]|uniref:uncharacterized protein LOC131890882 isoform X1 n=1 Tax=Tigriopus californicus TaxID=6832 RepID=UPI0027D9E730|nr:uncharacterized protein LOC131890882 isoform X1 [Tigriopus californicus]
MCSNIEISLVPPKSHHASFHFPGEPIEGRLFLTGLIPNTLYTVLIRHLGITQLVTGPKNTVNDGQDVDQSVVFSEEVGSNPVCMFQFMCIYSEQWDDMPSQVKDHIKIHRIFRQRPSNLKNETCQVIESFDLVLAPKSPNSISTNHLGSCQNFIEVKCFSSEFGFQKARFPIHVRAVQFEDNSQTTRDPVILEDQLHNNVTELGANHNQTLEGARTLFHVVDLNEEVQPDEPLRGNRGIPCLPKKKFSPSLRAQPRTLFRKHVPNLENESARPVGDHRDPVFGSLSYSVKLARSCCAGQQVQLEGDFQLHSNTENGTGLDIFVELDCQVMAQTDTDNGKENGNDLHQRGSWPMARECLVRERWKLGNVPSLSSHKKGPDASSTKLKISVPIGQGHPISGFQNWVNLREEIAPRGLFCSTRVHLIVRCDNNVEQWLGTLGLAVKPTPLRRESLCFDPEEGDGGTHNQPRPGGSIPPRKSRRKLSQPNDSYGQEKTCIPLQNCHGRDPPTIEERKLSGKLSKTTGDGDLTTSDNGECNSILETTEARFDLDLNEERKLKLLHNTSALTPTNSIHDSCHGESNPDSKVDNDLNRSHLFETKILDSIRGIEIAPYLPNGRIEMTHSEKRTRQFRNVFLGLLKMRYAAGDQTVVNYRERRKKKTSSSTPLRSKSEDPSLDSVLSSDSYSTEERQTALKRRIQRKKHKSGNLIPMPPIPKTISGDNNGEQEIASRSNLDSVNAMPDLERLKSGEMSLCSDLEEGIRRGASPPQSNHPTLFQHKQIMYHQSLPGSISDLKCFSNDPMPRTQSS